MLGKTDVLFGAIFALEIFMAQKLLVIRYEKIPSTEKFQNCPKNLFYEVRSCKKQLLDDKMVKT